jgi:hypothetical protein
LSGLNGHGKRNASRQSQTHCDQLSILHISSQS